MKEGEILVVVEYNKSIVEEFIADSIESISEEDKVVILYDYLRNCELELGVESLDD